MAKNLEDIEITIAVERDIKNDEESVKASETVLQFIMNGMIDKKNLVYTLILVTKKIMNY